MKLTWKLAKHHRISIRIIVVFTVAIFSTFVGDNLHEFFGDFKCSNSCDYMGNHSRVTWHWGYRHWLYIAMCISLFIVQINRIIDISDE